MQRRKGHARTTHTSYAQTLGCLVMLLAAATVAKAQQTQPPPANQLPVGQLPPGQQPASQQPANQPPAQSASPQSAQPVSPVQPGAPLGAPAGAQTQPTAPAGGQGQPGVTGEQGAAAPPPDTRPLAGAQLVTPTLPGSGRSYILPSFSFWEGADSNAQLMPGTNQFEAATVPEGSLELNHQSRTNQFGLTYGGGALIYDTHSGNNATFQEFGVEDTYTGRRWTVFVTDRGSYLPQPITGFSGIGFAGAFSGFQSLGLSGGMSTLSPGFGPEQSILTGRSGITSNTAVAQAQYSFTARTSISASGALGYVHFSQGGLLSGNNELMVFSLDHLLTPTDSVSISYSFTAFRYSGGSAAINNNLWRIGYGHRISERFTMSVVGGPQVTYSALRGLPGVIRRVSWAGQALLGYRASRGGFSLSYAHFLSPGSGLYQGAQTDDVRGSLSYDVTRTWTGSLGLGYSRNAAIADYSINPNFTNPGRIGYEYGTIRITHPIGRNMQWFALYELERQGAGQAFVPGGPGRILYRHVFGIGMQFHPRPIRL